MTRSNHHLAKPIETAERAVGRIRDGATVAIGGSGAGHAVPDLLIRKLGERHETTGSPTNLTLIHPFGVGDQQSKGLQQAAFAGMYRRVIGGHWSMAPKMAQLAAENRFAAYCLPAGVIVQLFHCAAAGSPGWFSHVGLETFVDPRREGGRLNALATEELVEFVERDGQPWHFSQVLHHGVLVSVGAYKNDLKVFGCFFQFVIGLHQFGCKHTTRATLQ